MRERLAHRRNGAAFAREHREAERRILEGQLEVPEAQGHHLPALPFPGLFLPVPVPTPRSAKRRAAHDQNEHR